VDPVKIVDQIQFSVDQYADREQVLVESLERELGDDLTEELSAEIKSGVASFMDVVFGAIDVNFDKFEVYVGRNILRVPPGLMEEIVAEDKNNVTKEEEDTVTEQLNLLIQQNEAADVMEKLLQAESAALDAELAFFAEEVEEKFPKLKEVEKKHKRDLDQLLSSTLELASTVNLQVKKISTQLSSSNIPLGNDLASLDAMYSQDVKKAKIQ
jgi:hypothetical protein